MVTKLDILNKRDGKDVLVGEELPWDIIDGKVVRVKKEEVRIEGPIVRETIEVVVPEERKEEKEKRKKKGGSKRTQRRKK